MLLGAAQYGPEVDMWSVGCLFAEFLTKEPLFPGKAEADQIDKVFVFLIAELLVFSCFLDRVFIAHLTYCNVAAQIFALLGTPNEDRWPGIEQLRYWKQFRFKKYPYVVSF